MSGSVPTRGTEPRPVYRKDYRPPDFLIDTVDLDFDLDPLATTVKSRLTLRRNPLGSDPSAPLRLDGEDIKLLSVRLDGVSVEPDPALQEPGALVLAVFLERFVLEIETRIAPQDNTELSGLYTSGGNFYTQCEAQGFRRITYFADRPDVMAKFTTTIRSGKGTAPVLLSNGNPAGCGEEPGGRHWARWVDPHPKPPYLFALVAGDLVAVKDQFTTRSGRNVDLAIWVRRGDEDKCGHAMSSLKSAMAWDEQVFGLEYDLDVFNIAAVPDFNMGAMENKGLNIFNSKFVLAKADTATDSDYQNIQAVIAHEYFHNWTGNRVTCRDWFQLSLKEGLTVYRDQEFSADQGSRAVKRISDVRRLRETQFPEDDGPLAHPVRPESYIAIDNFYTATVYQKGAEVVRMMQTLIGKDNFRKGMDLYIARHDNQAATIEDFIAALQHPSGIDLNRFRLWYEQAGTPELTVEEAFDRDSRQYTMRFRQSIRPAPGQREMQPLPIPIAMGLLGPDGKALSTRLAGEDRVHPDTRVLLVERSEQVFTFEDVAELPVPSLLRGFSAPVRLSGLSDAQLRFLAAHDSDPYVRWNAGQEYLSAVMLDMVSALVGGRSLSTNTGLFDTIREALAFANADMAFAAEAVTLPSEAVVGDKMEVAEPDAIHEVRDLLRSQIGTELEATLRDCYATLVDRAPYVPDAGQAGRRALRNAALSYLAASQPDGVSIAKAQYDSQANMTDVLAALRVLADSDSPARLEALEDFYARWRHDDLVVDKWFGIQAASSRPEALAEVRALFSHPAFDLRAPNRVRALVGAFSANYARFHDRSGDGYRLLAEAIVALDPLNSQIAARLVTPLGQWRRQGLARQEMMRAALQGILQTARLSKNTYEQVARILA